MFRKNVAGQHLYFALVNASTGAALTGASVTGKRSIDGGAQADVTGTISEIAGGQYKLALSQADTNGDNIGFLFTATSAIPVALTAITTACDPTNATTFGIGNLDAAITTRSTYAGSDTAGTTTLLSRMTSTRAGYLDYLDASVSSRLASSSYTAPDNTAIAAIAGYVDTEVAAIKAKTDQLTFTGSNVNAVASVSVDTAGIAAAVDASLTANHGAGAWTSSAGGSGAYTINHDTGGTDNLRCMVGSVPVENAVIQIYLKSDYDAGNLSSAFIKRISRTRIDGRWEWDCLLEDPGTYVVLFYKEGYFLPSAAEVTI